MIKYISGDLLDSDSDIIAHGCNCFHTMGFGIAKQLRNKYPMIYKMDKKHSKYGDKSKLGHITFYEYIDKKTNKTRFIVNCYTQYNYGRNKNVVYANYDAIAKCMMNLASICQVNNCTISIPKIGAGLANGDWSIISKIIENIFVDIDICVYDNSEI